MLARVGGESESGESGIDGFGDLGWGLGYLLLLFRGFVFFFPSMAAFFLVYLGFFFFLLCMKNKHAFFSGVALVCYLDGWIC